MLACFVGDNLKDMHSMTASGAMEKKWGRKKLDELISEFGQDGVTTMPCSCVFGNWRG